MFILYIVSFFRILVKRKLDFEENLWYAMGRIIQA